MDPNAGSFNDRLVLTDAGEVDQVAAMKGTLPFPDAEGKSDSGGRASLELR